MLNILFVILAWGGFSSPNTETKKTVKPKPPTTIVEETSKPVKNKEIEKKQSKANEAETAASPKYDVEVLSETPRIVLFHNFLSPAECDQLIKDATPHLERSLVVNPVSTESKLDEARTSKGMFFSGRGANSLVAKIEARIAAVTETPVENGESIQVLHYHPGAEYKPHYDYFDPSTVGGAAAYNRGGQRIMTLIMYLHDTEEGGETIFPKANIAVKPVKGNAVLFYNCLPSGQEDNLTLHGGAPVIKGEKWIATKWIRKGEFQ